MNLGDTNFLGSDEPNSNQCCYLQNSRSKNDCITFFFFFPKEHILNLFKSSELERMAQVYSQPPPEIKVSGAESNGGTRYGSVSSTLGSLGAGTEYNPLNDSSNSNPARGVFAHTITADRIRRRLKWVDWSWVMFVVVTALSILCTFLFAFFCSRYSLDHFLNLSLFVISHVFSVSVYFKIELQGPYEEGKMSKDKRMEEEDGVSGK